MRHTAQSVHELLTRSNVPILYSVEDIPTKQDIEDIGLRDALRRLLKAEDECRFYMEGDIEKILGVRLEDEGIPMAEVKQEDRDAVAAWLKKAGRTAYVIEAAEHFAAELREAKEALAEAERKGVELAHGYAIALLFLGDIERAIPTTWLDPLLTGPRAVIGKPPYTCADIEKLLHAIKQIVMDKRAAFPETREAARKEPHHD